MKISEKHLISFLVAVMLCIASGNRVFAFSKKADVQHNFAQTEWLQTEAHHKGMLFEAFPAISFSESVSEKREASFHYGVTPVETIVHNITIQAHLLVSEAFLDGRDRIGRYIFPFHFFW